jgi:hypothetical protein
MNARELLRRTLLAFAGAASTAMVAWLAAASLRDGVVARDDFGTLCTSATAPGWCVLRQLVILAFQNHVFSFTSVALSAFAVWRRSAFAAHAAIAAGIAGLVLWDHGWSAVGVLGGALIAARLQNEREQQAQAEGCA